MTTRSRKAEKSYKYDRKKLPVKGCVFCDIDSASHQMIKETANFKIIQNIYPYTYWDLQRVTDHIMVVPKCHTDTISDIKKEHAQEYLAILSEYEKQGYNIYMRAPGDSIKTVVHQHTHLIKPKGKRISILLYITKPHVRFMR